LISCTYRAFISLICVHYGLDTAFGRPRR
jgi:hypothetical protein